MDLTEAQYDEIKERADTGEAPVTLQEAKDCVDWMLREGREKYRGMTSEMWLRDVRDLLEGVEE